MNRNKKIVSLLGLSMVSSMAVLAKDSRPNMIFILTDDQPYELLGCTGNSVLQTPNIDRLAKVGIKNIVERYGILSPALLYLAVVPNKCLTQSR